MNAISQLNTDWTKVSQAQQSSQYQTTIARVVVRNITDIALELSSSIEAWPTGSRLGRS